VVACRTELFGLIAGGDQAGADAAITRAAEAGLPADELTLFRCWNALAAGEDQSTSLPLGAVPLLGVILEALLRVQDFLAFEKLVPLLAGSQLPAREQRELLATIYLQRGFQASAAEEWMAVCNQHPDARALVGLARVAAAHGFDEGCHVRQ
jgi:hypothetical protein